MQEVVCYVRNCGYCSSNGFCQNRVVAINLNGTCSYLTKPGWEQQIEEKYKDKRAAPGPAENEASIEEEQEQNQNYDEDIAKEE